MSKEIKECLMCGSSGDIVFISTDGFCSVGCRNADLLEKRLKELKKK